MDVVGANWPPPVEIITWPATATLLKNARPPAGTLVSPECLYWLGISFQCAYAVVDPLAEKP